MILRLYNQSFLAELLKTNEIPYLTERKIAQYFYIISKINSQRTREQINLNILLKRYFFKVIFINIFYRLKKISHCMNR